MIVDFEITRNMIRKGKKDDPMSCPTVLAIRKRLPGTTVHVGYMTISVDRGVLWAITAGVVEPKIIATPTKLRKWITNFDSRPKRFARPYKFQLNIPRRFIRNA